MRMLGKLSSHCNLSSRSHPIPVDYISDDNDVAIFVEKDGGTKYILGNMEEIGVPRTIIDNCKTGDAMYLNRMDQRY